MEKNWIRMARKLNEEERAAAIARMEVDLEELIPTPLRAIKQVELWKKWGPLLPEELSKGNNLSKTKR